MSLVKRILRWGLVLSAIAAGVLAQRPTNHAARFNPSGEYHPLNQPADDRGVQIHLRVRHKHGRLVASGEVAGTSVQFYTFRFVSVTQKHLRFSTERHHGVNYNFEGAFLRLGNFTTALDIPGSAPLRGTLRKFVNGKKVMELTTSFVYYVGC
jgi:hypothetical protein